MGKIIFWHSKRALRRCRRTTACSGAHPPHGARRFGSGGIAHPPPRRIFRLLTGTTWCGPSSGQTRPSCASGRISPELSPLAAPRAPGRRIGDGASAWITTFRYVNNGFLPGPIYWRMGPASLWCFTCAVFCSGYARVFARLAPCDALQCTAGSWQAATYRDEIRAATSRILKSVSRSTRQLGVGDNLAEAALPAGRCARGSPPRAHPGRPRGETATPCPEHAPGLSREGWLQQSPKLGYRRAPPS